MAGSEECAVGAAGETGLAAAGGFEAAEHGEVEGASTHVRLQRPTCCTEVAVGHQGLAASSAGAREKADVTNTWFPRLA